MNKKKQIQPKIKTFKLSELQPAEYNPRAISDEALAGLAVSIQKFGCVEPIIVNVRKGANTIVGGNQRFKVLSATGVESAVCITVDLSETDEKLLNLALNNPHTQGEFIEELAEYIDELRETLPNDADYLGLRIGLLRQQLGASEKIGLTDDDEIPKPPKKAITRPGDIWQIGDHKLLCGDSTDMGDVLKLMGKKKAKMCFTSPPYNMGGDMYEHYKDSMLSSQYIGFNLTVAKNVQKVLRGFLFWNISYNANTRWEYIEIFYHLIKSCGFTFLESIVWDKERAMPITSDKSLTRQYENILLLTNRDIGCDLDFCFVGTNQKTWAFDKIRQRGVSNFWRIPVTEKIQMEEHKACFPVALPCKAIDLMSKPGDIIIEPFCGSGSTLIAAEKLGRKCNAIELSPEYCDVTVKRWEQWTGGKAEIIKQ